MRRVVNEEVLVLIGLLAIAVSLYLSSLSQSFSDVESAHSPVFFPRIVLILWAGLSVLALAQVLILRPNGAPLHGFWRLALLAVAVVIYTNIVTVWGFFLASFAFVLVSLPLFGVWNPIVIIPYAILVPGSLVVLFNHILGRPLPISPFTHLF